MSPHHASLHPCSPCPHCPPTHSLLLPRPPSLHPVTPSPYVPRSYAPLLVSCILCPLTPVPGSSLLPIHRSPGPPQPQDPASPRCAGRRAQVDARALRGDQRRAHPNTPAPPPAPWIGSPQAGRARIGSRGAVAGPVSRWVAPQRGCCSVPPRPPGAWSPSGQAGPGGDTAGSSSAAHPVPSAKGSPGPRPHPGAAGGGQRAMQGRGTRRGARWSGGPRRRR